MTAVNTIQGISSGIQWQDMVDQLIAVDSTRELDPITAQITSVGNQSAAWSSYRSVAQSLADAATGLRDGTAFGNATATGGTSPTSGRALYTATASNGAQPGQYQVEVLSLAQAEKVGGNAVASASTALGFTGAFTVNGQKVSVSATDTLATIRDAINVVAPNSGVHATTLATTGGGSRLVLTSDTAGSRGIELVDSASSGGVLQQLGLLDGTYSFSTNDVGRSTSAQFTASDKPVATVLGLAAPAPSSIRVGNVTINVDLSTDSISDIATRLQAAGVDAAVTSNTSGAVATYALDVGGNVSAIPDGTDASVPDANSLRTLQLLGFAQGGRAALSQAVASPPLTATGGATATTSTLVSDVNVAGVSANIQAGDTITVNGRRGDGSAVTMSFAVGAGSTLNDLVTALNGTNAFGGGARPATASIGPDGAIHLTDGTAGDSQLVMSLSVAKSVANGGGSTGLGAFHVEATGRQREIVAGSDAQVRVDGVLQTRTSNTISDAINGVTLKLQQSEVGSVTTLDVERDDSATVTAMQAFAKAYNDVISFVTTNTATGGPLANNGSLRASGRSMTQALLTDILGPAYSRATLVGVSLDKTGTLTVDATALTAALKQNVAGVQALFGLNGAATGTGLEYIAAADSTLGGSYAVNITAPATAPTVASTAPTLPFNDGGVPATMTFTDGASGKSGSITLATGDDATAIAGKLSAMFTSKGLNLTASVQGGVLNVSGSGFGAASSFTVAYGAGDTTSAGQVGIAAQSYRGTDVAGTIDGIVATGIGQSLTANSGSNASGLVVRYSGTATGPIGNVTVTVGTGALVSRLARGITQTGDGLIDTMTTSLGNSTTRLQAQSDTVSARLDRTKTALLAQFQAMETAIGKINAQGAQITSMFNALQTSSK